MTIWTVTIRHEDAEHTAKFHLSGWCLHIIASRNLAVDGTSTSFLSTSSSSRRNLILLGFWFQCTHIHFLFIQKAAEKYWSYRETVERIKRPSFREALFNQIKNLLGDRGIQPTKADSPSPRNIV